jgi:hypothetical protein
MEIKFNNINEFKAALEAGKITSPRFISIRNYENKAGEISNYILNLGIKHIDLIKRDLVFLNFMNHNDFEMPTIAKAHSEIAYEELIKSLEKNSSNNIEEHTTMSQAMINTFTQIAPNVKIHNETGDIYITGYIIRKTVITPGNYPTRNKRAKTIAKDAMRKFFRTSKHRTFILKNITNLRLNGKELVIE